MQKYCKWFYSFAGIHSFLIGLFLFFVPVFLWKEGFSLAQVSLFIAFVAMGYLLMLMIWDRIRQKISLHQAITLSLVIEVITLASVFWLQKPGGFLLFGLLHGFYNGLFWTLQRTLFLDTITEKDTGRKYGNFQIFVFLVLKVSIFIGSFVLEKSGFPVLFALSLLVSFLGILFFSSQKPFQRWEQIQEHPKLSFQQIRSFTDTYRSKYIFWLDGPFLFFESFFWTLSLFWLLEENFLRLGMLVIVLSVLFSVLFWGVKNMIDHLPQLKNHIYGLSILLYALSWFGRGFLRPDLDFTFLFLILLGINFGTAFFRLTFNKRFFDLTKNTSKHHYIYLKSYYSQISIVITFGILTGYFTFLPHDERSLSILYFILGGVSFLYLLYRPYKEAISSEPIEPLSNLNPVKPFPKP